MAVDSHDDGSKGEAGSPEEASAQGRMLAAGFLQLMCKESSDRRVRKLFSFRLMPNVD